MILTDKQNEGLKIAVQRYNEGEMYTCIAGYAGTGKSTLISFIIDALGVEKDLVAYVAYTGKAAIVLKNKGCENAVTAHKLLYFSEQTKDGKYLFVKRRKLEKPYKVIVVDEVSMLPKEMWELLLSHRIYVLACGDPAQLPPIDKDSDNHVLDRPHVFLDEIMRQACDSEIIRLSMHIREGNSLSSFKEAGEQVKIFDAKDILQGMYSWADQIICATNRKKNVINQLVRRMNGQTDDFPVIGDKIIGLKNHWDIFSTKGNALTNGLIGTISKMEEGVISIPRYIANAGNGETEIPVYNVTIEVEDDEKFVDLQIDKTALTTGQKFLTPRQEYMLSRASNAPEPPLEFNYAYAITCWKAQGSEWNKILLFEEGFPFEEEEHRRYLYTGITRAADKIVIIK